MPLELGVIGVVEWLKSKDVIVPGDWVSACLDWLSSENQGSITKEKMCQMVYEQWLYTNLRELEVQTLPNSVKNDASSLTGCYCLQIESVQDVSQSKNQADENKCATSSHTQNKWEKKAARLLMLRLCDGTNTVNAIELKSIASLNENIRLGSKVHIKGPVKCRRGVILLEPHNIDLLGGEVEDLLEADNENQLSHSAEASESTEIVSSHPLVNDHGTGTNEAAQFATLNGSDAESNSVSNTHVQVDRSSRVQSTLKQRESSIISLISDDEDQEIIECLEETERGSHSHFKQDTGNVKTGLPIHVGMDRSGNECLNMLSPVRASNQTKSPPPECLCHCKRYLNQKIPVIHVKAVVTTLLSKLKYDSVAGWSLQACICDGTAVLEVEFNNDVLLSLIGHSGDRDFLSSANPELKHRLKNCQNTIMSVCHYMDVSLRSIESRIVGTVSKIEGIS